MMATVKIEQTSKQEGLVVENDKIDVKCETGMAKRGK